MHRLVQAVTRIPDPADPHYSRAAIKDARDQATALLAAAAPRTWQDPAGWPVWRTWLPHIQALASHTATSTDTIITAALLDRAAAFLQDQGDLGRAIPLYETTSTDCIRVLGKDRPLTETVRSNLGWGGRVILQRVITLHLAPASGDGLH